MTKKDYIAIAAIIESIPYDAISKINRLKLILKFAHLMGEDNPRFDKARFTVACLGEETYEMEA